MHTALTPRIALLALWTLLLGPGLGSAGEAPTYQATTTTNIDIPTDELALLVKPLTAAQLEVEADAWLALLQEKTRETSQAELAIKQKNKAIEKASEVQDAIEDTQEVLEEVKDASREAADEQSQAAAEDASEKAAEAEAAVEETANAIDEAIDTAQQIAQDESVQQAMDTSGDAAELAQSAAEARTATAEVSAAASAAAAAAERGEDATALAEQTTAAVDRAEDALDDTSAAAAAVKAEQLEDTAEAVQAIAESQQEDKLDILESVNELKAQRTALADRLGVVVDELSKKLGTPAGGGEHELVIPYRLYATAVNEVEVDVSDTQALWSNIVGWIYSDVGGLRLAKNLGKFVAIVAGFWILGLAVGKLVDKALKLTRMTLELMRSVIVRMVRRGIILVGIIMGLSAMEINVGPILAVVGAAGFVIAFALQNTLSNFASGIMIMIYRPFDVGDMISVGGVTGVAQSMNLVTTTIATPDNQLLVVPNNSIWGNIITNITGSETRRVDMVFGIRYEDDLELAQQILEEVVASHPLVLKEPEPLVAVQELAESRVNFVCRPWVKTDDYWHVLREITQRVKLKFENAGMAAPYPRRSLEYSPASTSPAAGTSPADPAT